jgi:hypothetical protein
MKTKQTKPSVRVAGGEDIDSIHRILDMEPFKYDDNLHYERSWIE